MITTVLRNDSYILPSDDNDIEDHLIDPAGSIVPTISIFVHSSAQPTTTNNVHDCFSYSNPFKSFWIQTIYEQYDKNASYRVFTKPIKKSYIESGTLILKSVLAPTVKQTDIPSLWKLNIRHCVNGKPMKGLTSYGETRASTVSPNTVRFQLSYGAALGFIHRTYDCTNAFQCTFENDLSKRVYCYLPPFYIQWYNSRYPHDKINPDEGPYVMQAAQLIQGSPHAAHRWQENISLQLKNMGFIRNNIDHSFYIKYDRNNDIEALLSVAVDDLLLTYREEPTQQYFYKNISSAFDITTPSDITRMKFLSLHIYQSTYGTSINQTNHIGKILSTWIDKGHEMKVVNFPFPTDSTFEQDLSQSPALTDKELDLYEKRYHGAFNHTLGKLLHIQQWTRVNINFAVTRLASYTRNPNKPAFVALEQLMRYLHSHMHEPIFYPRKRTNTQQLIKYNFSPTQNDEYYLSPHLVFFTDSSFGNILPQRRSMQSNCGLYNGVVITWTTNIQTSIAADSTDAELRALYTTIKQIESFSHFLLSSDIKQICQYPITLYGDNQASINIITENKISSRSRHLDIPVTYSYEKLMKKYFTIQHINSRLNPADISTKATSGPLLARHWNFLRGSRFYPYTSTPHGLYLTSLIAAQRHTQTHKR